MADNGQTEKLDELARLIRYYILTMTTEAGSGHPTSSLSAVELTTCLLFGGFFRFDVDKPKSPANDRLIFSKGHASPLLYALWAAAGKISEKELLTYRKFGSLLEGHPTTALPYVEAATGSLGQGLSIGVGMALNAKYLGGPAYRSFVLLGDSEMAEGSQWEAIQIAAHYGLDNLIGILDVNRLGQRGQTMYGWDLHTYAKMISSFGWRTIICDGHSFPEIASAYREAFKIKDRPAMVIAKTIKGEGVSFIEDMDGWHGKPLNREDCDRALKELGKIDKNIRGEIAPPVAPEPKDMSFTVHAPAINYPADQPVATRLAYGKALAAIYPHIPNIVVLDGEVGNSTYAEVFKAAHPERFFEMYIAEQNMVGTAIGLSARGRIPFVSTFGAFFSRAFDQIRMSRYSDANIKFAGSHAGVSIGEDGPSQMGLEDIALFRTILDSVVLYPADAYAATKLVTEAALHRGIVYIRTTRKATPILYGPGENFPIGGSKVLRQSDADAATVCAAGVTLYEALAAYDELIQLGVVIRIIDLYSVKPLDVKTLQEAAATTKFILTVEDHYGQGGIGEAVCSALAGSSAQVHSLYVARKPKSGTPQELLDYEGISKAAICAKVKMLLSIS
ncbi:MAG: transketolase [Smithellaceae bacterium]|nr:transketolase [Smithellaceae bacterium]